MKKFHLNIVDKYISKQILDTFLLGIVVFTSLSFASDQFLDLVKQISAFGIPFKIAFLGVLLQLPYIIVMAIPMAVLLASILTFNKLNTSQEITAMRACGISLGRLAMPVVVFGLLAALGSFLVNEFVAPAASSQARNIMVWAITQKNMPNDKYNFSFKEYDVNKKLKRLFYVGKYENKKLESVTVLDLSKSGTIQVLQAKGAEAAPDSWKFFNAVNYTISSSGKIMNTAVFEESVMKTDFSLDNLKEVHKARELNFFALSKYINELKKEGRQNLAVLKINLYEKITMPVTSFLVALIGIPLAISPPRSKFNRGLLFSILIIFCYYLLRAVSSSMGEAQIIVPMLAAWLPNLIVLSVGSYLFYKKAYTI